MIQMVDQLFGLVGKVIGYLLDWPFLLFIFLVWVVSRYRDQIGSMLDRRSAVKASTLSRAVRREMEPLLKRMESFGATVSELSSDVERLKSLQGQDTVTPALEPINSRVAALDTTLSELRTAFDRLVQSELPEMLTGERDAGGRELEKVRAESGALREAVELLQSRMESLAARMATDRLEKDLEPVQRELATLRESVGALEGAVESAQTALEERLTGRMEPIAREVAEMRESLAQLQTHSERATAVQTIRGEESPIGLDSQALTAMKAELESPRWVWRRVETLAKAADITEEEALAILEHASDVILSSNNKGERIAKLASREG